MTTPNTVTGMHLLILLGDGANPENFSAAASCGIRATTFGRTAKATDFENADCDAPDTPQYVERILTSKSCTIAGEGYLNADQLDPWDDFYETGAPKNCRVRFDKPVVIAGRTYQGSFLCSKLEFKGQIAQKMAISIELQSTGPLAKSVT